MPLVLANVGLNQLLDGATGFASPPILYFRLFQNNVTPTQSSVASDFTEATFSNYAGATAIVWNSASGGGPISTALGNPISNTKNGATGNDIYGYFVTDGGGSTLYWAELFPGGPVSMNIDGEFLQVTPQRTLESKYT